MRAVPQRLEHRVGEPQRQQVLDGFLAEIMVDPENALLGEDRGDRIVDLPARLQGRCRAAFRAPCATVAGEARRLQPLDRRLEQRRRGRQENGQSLARIANFGGELGETLLIVDVEGDVTEPLKEPLDHAF